MRKLIGELDDLVFNRRTIARAGRLNLPAIHGRAMDVLADNAVRFFGSESDVARHLRVVMRHALGAKTERSGIGISGLKFEARPVDGASVKAGRGSGFQAASAKAEFLESFAEQDGCRLSRAPRWILLDRK